MSVLYVCMLYAFIHSFILNIYIAPLLGSYSEVPPMPALLKGTVPVYIFYVRLYRYIFFMHACMYFLCMSVCIFYAFLYVFLCIPVCIWYTYLYVFCMQVFICLCVILFYLLFFSRS